MDLSGNIIIHLKGWTCWPIWGQSPSYYLEWPLSLQGWFQSIDVQTYLYLSIYLYNYSPCAHNPIQKHQSRSSARYHWDEEQQHFTKQIGAWTKNIERIVTQNPLVLRQHFRNMKKHRWWRVTGIIPLSWPLFVATAGSATKVGSFQW